MAFFDFLIVMVIFFGKTTKYLFWAMFKTLSVEKVNSRLCPVKSPSAWCRTYFAWRELKHVVFTVREENFRNSKNSLSFPLLIYAVMSSILSACL